MTLIPTKLKIVYCFVYLAILLFVSHQSIAQSSQVTRLTPKPLPTSPNVAALEKFGNYSATSFSGLPEISIPIFEARSGELKAPITLSYHASGIKRTDHASWVGAGWALSAGGQLSRKINGGPDESGYYNATSPAIPASVDVCTNVTYLRGVASGSIDSRPDLWSYSFPGKSGKFMLGPQGTQPPFLIPWEPVNINVINFDKFEITDDKGVLHRFGQHADGTSASEGSNNGTSGNATSWYLREMIAPNTSDYISFNYQTIGTVYYNDVQNVVSLTDMCNLGGTLTTCPGSVPSMSTSNTTTTVTQFGLQSIDFENGKVEFVKGAFRLDDTQSSSLDKIKIYGRTNTGLVLQKVVQFYYSYFKSATSNNILLRLDQVEFQDGASLTVQRYKFGYNKSSTNVTKDFSWGNNIMARDMYGFYNGQEGNADLIPTQQISYQATTSSPVVNTNIGSANRSTNAQYLTEGVLNRIDFPTGGNTQFEYEPTQYLDGVTPVIVGGIRVKKISSFEGNGQSVIKTYKYGAVESGYGGKNFTDYQFGNFSNEQYTYYLCCMNESCGPGAIVGTGSNRTRTWFSIPAVDIDGYDNIPVVYAYVTEYQSDALGNNNGRTVYEYDGGTPGGTGVNFFVPGSTNYWRDSHAWENGKLTKVLVYDKNNNLLKQTINNYSITRVAGDFKHVGWAAAAFNAYSGQYGCQANYCIDPVDGFHLDPNEIKYTYLRQSSGTVLPTGSVETTYENGNLAKFVTVTKTISYEPQKNQVAQTVTDRSNSSEVLVSVMRYPFQVTGVNVTSTGAAKGLYMLNQKNIVSQPIETYNYVKNSGGGNERVTSGVISTFKQSTQNTNQVVADKIYSWERATPKKLSWYLPMAVNGANTGVVMDTFYVERVSMPSYDQNGNVTAVQKTNDNTVSYLYGYNGAMPVAEVSNAVHGNTTTTTQQSTGVQSVTFGGLLPGTVQTTINFTNDYAGTVTLKLGVSGNPSYTTNLSYTGITAGSVTLGKNGCGVTTITFNSVAAGAKSLTLTLTTPDNGVTSLGACGQIEYPKNVQVTTASQREFFLENFEEVTTGTNTDMLLAHTGNRYYNGDYTVNFTKPNARTYKIEYWYLDVDSKWKWTSATYTGPTMVLTLGSAIDDVRIYPTDARMKSFTYNPQYGMTSAIDQNGQTMIYDYDSYGRLLRIRNDKGTVEKQYTYHYKNP